MLEDLDWQPGASLLALRRRADLYADIRAFFAARSVLEVETPALSAAAVTDRHIESLRTQAMIDGPTLYLHTSPEFPMKRLLAAGSGDIWQLCKVFRAGEAGRRHNPEFSMLEWYRLGYDHHHLMDEVAELLAELDPTTAQPPTRLSYAEAIADYAGLDVVSASAAEIRQCIADNGVALPEGLGDDRDLWLDLLMSTVIAPRFPPDAYTFLHDYPASQAALSRIVPGEPPVAARFEVFRGELELANGFWELADAHEQRARFEAEQDLRRAAGQVVPPLDERLIGALHHGLPDCAGVALGVDRLLMLLLGTNDIRDVLAFSLERA
jgi:lysyl-tRNA synthetase class 2